jgi:hypothetical protein
MHIHFSRCILLLGFTLLSLTSFSQNPLIFCLGIDQMGHPVDSGEAFSIPRDGAFINLLVYLDSPVNTDTVQMDVYKKQIGINDKYLNSFSILVKKDYTSFITDYTFEREGVYYFYVYGHRKKQIAFGRVTIEYQRY